MGAMSIAVFIAGAMFGYIFIAPYAISFTDEIMGIVNCDSHDNTEWRDICRRNNTVVDILIPIMVSAFTGTLFVFIARILTGRRH